MISFQTLYSAIRAVKSMQVIRMDQLGDLNKTYATEEAKKSLLNDYSAFCDAEKELNVILENKKAGR